MEKAAVFIAHYFLLVNSVNAAGSKVLEYNFSRPLQTIPSVDHDGTIYVAGKGAVASLTATGTENWKVELSPGSQADISGVTVSDDRIYVASTEGLFALVKSGVPIWTNQISIINSKVALDGPENLYVVGGGTLLYALDADGSQRWTNSVDPSMGFATSLDFGPVVGPTGLIYTSAGRTLAFNASGDRQWAIESWNFQAPPIINEDGSILQSKSELTTSISQYTLDGTQVWTNPSFEVDGRIIAPAVKGRDGTLYVPITERSDFPVGGGLEVFDSEGDAKWRIEDFPTAVSPAVAADGTVYISSTEGVTAAYNSEGSRLWAYTNGVIAKGIALGTDGKVLLAQTNGVLIGLSGTVGVPDGVWPVYGHDARQTSQQRIPAMLTMLPVEEIGTNTALFRAELNPAGRSAIYFFEYSDGATVSRTAPVNIAASGEDLEVSNTVTALNGGTVYRVSLVISNSFGLAKSGTVAFTTLGTPVEFPPILESLTSAAIAGGTIKFAADGIIEINNPVEFATNVVLDANGHRVVLTGNGASSLIRILDSAQVTLKGLHLTRGKAAPVSEANAVRARGGAIQNLGGTLTITDCTFSNNVAVVTQPDSSAVADASGGAIWQSQGSLQIHSSTFMNNQTEGIPFAVQFVGLYPQARGGAITIDGGTLEIEGSHFAGNSVAGVPGAGGAIFFQGTEFKVQESRFETNSASIEPRGGAIYVQSGRLELTNSVFVMNEGFAAGENFKMGISGSASGGAIYNAADVLISATSFLTNRTTSGPGGPPFYESSVSSGGAIFNDGTITVVNSTFAGDEAVSPGNLGQLNKTHGRASAVFSTDGSITNSTFVAGRWGKSLVEGSNPANLRVKNSIFANIPAQTVLPEGMIPLDRFSLVNFTDAGHNLSSDAPQFTEATSKTNVNLRLGPLGYYGDTKPVYPLLAGSPAIDAADNSAAPPTDQRGRARPFGAHSDIGAFESSAPFHVWGKIKGYQDPSTIFTVGTNSFAISANGEFSLGTLPAGTNQITISAENAVFLPNPWLVDIIADGAVSGFTSFELHALTYHGSITEPKFVLAGLEGEQWKVEMTQDFQTWSDIGTFTIDNSGSTTVPVPAGDTLFLRVTGQ